MSESANDPLPPRRVHSVRQRQSMGLDDPEVEFQKIMDDPARLLSRGSVWTQVQKTFEGSSDDDIVQTSLNVSLVCPISKRRIEVPARGRSCDIRHCFDLMTYLTDKKAKAGKKDPVKFECPHRGCNAKLPLEDLRIDGLLRDALQNFDVGVKAAEIRADGVFPVVPQQNVAPATVDNDAVLGDVEQKPDPLLTVPRSALDKLVAAVEGCRASLKDSEGELVAKYQLVQGSLAEENGVPRPRSKKPTSADRDAVSAQCKEIDGRLRQLKSKVEAHIGGVSADEDRNITMRRSELHGIRDSHLEAEAVLSNVALPSSGPIRDAFAVLSECVKGLVEAADVTIEERSDLATSSRSTAPTRSSSAAAASSNFDKKTDKGLKRKAVESTSESAVTGPAFGSSYARFAQEMKAKMRETLKASTRAIKVKKGKLDELNAKLNAEPPRWVVDEGRARREKYKREIEQRITRYNGQIAMLNEKYEDLEKSRFVLKVLNSYYSPRHGNHYRTRHGCSEKFVDIINGGCNDPVQVVARLWLSQSKEVRNLVFTQFLEHFARRRHRNPSKPRPSLKFDTLDAVNCFCEVKLS